MVAITVQKLLPWEIKQTNHHINKIYQICFFPYTQLNFTSLFRIFGILNFFCHTAGKFYYSFKRLFKTARYSSVDINFRQGGRSCATARPPVTASAGAPALAGSPSIRAFVAKSVLTRITRYWMHYFQLFSATSTVKMPVFMKNYNFFWQNCKKKRRLCCKNLQW